MLNENFERAIKFTLPHEGGFVDDPQDKGGATNFGISLYFLKAAGHIDLADLNHDGRVDVADIRSMTREQAVAIYKELWWDKYHYDNISNAVIAAKVFDMAVNMGGTQCHKLAQRAACYCGKLCSADGIFGPISFNAICSVDPECWMRNFQAECKSFYVNLSISKPVTLKYLGGWLNRVKDVRI